MSRSLRRWSSLGFLALGLVACGDASEQNPLAAAGPVPPAGLSAPFAFAPLWTVGGVGDADFRKMLVGDAFSRTVETGWGDPDVGGSWKIDSSIQESFSVGDGVGTITMTGHQPLNAVATAGHGMNVRGLASFSVDWTPDAASFYTVQVYARRDDSPEKGDGNYYYRYRVRVHHDGAMDVRIEKKVGESRTFVNDSNVDLPAMWTSGARYWMRWEAIGTSPATALRMRVWQDGTPEPQSWQIDVTHDEPELDVPGTTGVRVEDPNQTQTTWPIVFTFDDLSYSEVPVELVTDSFSRTVESGWGEPDVGGRWLIADPEAESFRVVDGVGLITRGDSRARNAVASAGFGLDVQGITAFSLEPMPDARGFYTVQVYARRDDSDGRGNGDFHYRYRVRAHMTGKMDLRIEKEVAGSKSFVSPDNVRIPAEWFPGAWYWIRWQAVGTSPATALRMRVWRDGDPEPDAWQIDLLHDEPALDFPGTTGYRVEGPNQGQLTWPVTAAFDELRYVGLWHPETIASTESSRTSP